jgi:anaphase-promoting complex subunit 10
LLTIHFLRRVEIRAIRFYVDYNHDESYTPTNIVFYAGTGHHDLIQFAELQLTNPLGWQDVPISGCGGGPDGNSLCCWLVQMHIRENHQNGKDTHIRGIKLFATDENIVNGGGPSSVHEMAADINEAADNLLDQNVGDNDSLSELLQAFESRRNGTKWDGGFSSVPDFMRDPEIR